jgi:hypothetical protein
MKFAEWLDTFLDEKSLDMDQIFLVDGASGENSIPLAVLVEHMKIAPVREQCGIKEMLVKLDYANANISLYLKHLCKAIAR